jgi:hydrogenase expression/formation protein HypE
MTDFNLSCPIPLEQYPQILLAHGGGGQLMHQLIDRMFAPTFQSFGIQHDSTVVNLPTSKIAMTTDSYVVRPLFFPGGDIGSLSIYGTVNDLAMSGARPLYLSVGFILEEGLAMETLWQIVQSMQQAAAATGVRIITGDTKVVDRGFGDGIFINTTGIGAIEHEQFISSTSVEPGDFIILNGDIGRHGMAIMAVREGLEFETTLESDLAPCSSLVLELLSEGLTVHCLRDLTRGGLASALNEIAIAAGVSIQIKELAIPVREDVRGACEILGFDPLYVANEGRFITFVPGDSVDRALKIIQSQNNEATIIGRVTEKTTNNIGLVTMESTIATARIIDTLSGEQLPRIC